MADLFAPKLQSEVAYERPVETPSTLSTLANLGEFFVDQYGRSQRGGGASGSTSADPNLATFAQGLERVEAIRDQQGESAALLAERQLAKNFATAGIEFGNEYEDIYTTTTGRQWAGYGRDVEAMMLDEALKDPEVQASYISSFVTLPKDATEDQRIEYAIGQKATINAAADVIARSKAEAGYKWSVQTEAAYAEGIDSFVNVGMGSLIQTTEAGGRVGPQALANLQASWSQQKVGLSRPPNITDQQWKSTQDKLKTVDDMFAMLIKASSSDVLFEEITTAFSNSLLEEGNGSTTSILAAASAIKDPVSLANLVGADTQKFIMDVSKSINLDITQPDLFSGVLSQADTTTDGGVTIIKELPKNVADKVSGLSPQEHFDALKASGKLTSIIDPNSLQRPDGKQQFVENAASIGAVMMSMDNDEFLSSDFLKQLVANPSFLRNITTLDGVDPEGAAVARSYVVSGLNTELIRQQENLRAVEATSLATWTGTNYTMDLADLEAKVGRNRMLRFNSALQKEYGGDILTGVRDGFRRMYDVTDLVQISGLYNLDAANDRRNSIGVIQSALNTLNPVEVPTTSDDSNNNLTPSENAEVTAAINEGSNLGIPLEDIDFDSNAPAKPTEPAEEIVVTPIDSEGNPTITLEAPLQSGFDSLTESEGTDIHLDGRNIITLPYGIVPDKNSIKKSDGTAIDPEGTHGLKESDLNDIDYSGATKFGLSRSSYSSDEQFAKAVYVEFGKQAGENYGTGFEDLSDKAKEAAYDIAWNAGVESTGWSSVKTMLDETSKDAATQTTDNLIGFTTNFRSGKEKVNNVSVNNYPRGLLKRRLTTYNLVAKAGEEAVDIVTTSVETNGKRTGTKYDIRKADGTVLKSWTKPDLNETLGTLSVN